MSLSAFATVCTAGILYPLDWIVGIRLAKEDELEGLDLASSAWTIYHSTRLKNHFVLILAHGESWEVAASRAIGTLVKKILQEQGDSKELPQDTGTFELHYNPKNPNKKGFAVTVLKRKKLQNSEISPDAQSSTQQQSSFNQPNSSNEETNTQLENAYTIRF